MGSYYDLLGVPRDATEMEIRSAYGRDALRLQNSSPANAATIRAALDEALAVLTDPVKKAEYDARLNAIGQDVAADAAVESERAFADARAGGLWFAGGGLVTAATYLLLDGTYFLAWGALIFGGYQLVRGLVTYLRVPSGARRTGQVALLGALVAVGLVCAGWVGTSEAVASQEVASWNAMIDQSEQQVDLASGLVAGVFNRSGAWSEQDSSEMGHASALYTEAADTVSRGRAPSELEWYRAGMERNFREAAAITRAYSQLTASSPQSAIEDLDRRWQARLEELKSLTDRFDSEVGSAP